MKTVLKVAAYCSALLVAADAMAGQQSITDRDSDNVVMCGLRLTDQKGEWVGNPHLIAFQYNGKQLDRVTTEIIVHDPNNLLQGRKFIRSLPKGDGSFSVLSSDDEVATNIIVFSAKPQAGRVGQFSADLVETYDRGKVDKTKNAYNGFCFLLATPDGANSTMKGIRSRPPIFDMKRRDK